VNESSYTIPELPGTIGGRYVLGKGVGSGSSGVVYVALDSKTRRQVAVKVREAHDKEQPVRFIAEAQDMARLRHSRLVPVLDAGNEGSFYWYVMPFYARGSLRDLVKDHGPIPALQALDWVFQILEGLHVVHRAGLVHRDVKPHNVLLDDDGHAVLTDFGLVRHVHGGVPYRTRTDQSMGTPNYRAPEQAADAANVDHRADIYGAGATLYFLVTGRRPGFLYMVTHDDAAMASVPEVLREHILRCMAYKPAERFEDARACAVEVARLADHVSQASGRPKVGTQWLARFDRATRPGWIERVKGWFGG
jgi:serine/threonine-protein kinase